MTIVQTFLYFRLYPKDQARIKFMPPSLRCVFPAGHRHLVRTVLLLGARLIAATDGSDSLLDVTHAALMCAATWNYLVLNFGNEEIADRIPITIGLTVALTATITFLVQLVFRLSRGNWFITAPLVTLSCVRLGAALVSTTKMKMNAPLRGKLRSYHLFVENFGYVFTLGLSTACTVDIGITVAICYFLQTSRTGFGEMDHIIDTIMLYTFNTGALTCVTTVVSLICWLTMPRNLIFLGLHFAISKLYANSLLATLNGRRSLRKRKMGPIGASHALPVLFSSCDTCARSRARFQSKFESFSPTSEMDRSRLEISIEKTIRCDVDEEDPRGDRPVADQTV
ncbi:hypothetical protein EDB85DRAFT_1892155 [Lactarius pseudohatsudake]|nr:hypothetical protein EDB85DRAFT_1892155 [Lactarius pseudohatsudake]